MGRRSKGKKAGRTARASPSKQSRIGKAVSSVFGGKSKSGKRRRSRGPNYWANKVLVEKLKRRYYKLKYSGAGR